MTKEEHELMVLMFARVYESVKVISDVLKSNGVLTGDDPKAFSHAVHADDRKLIQCLAQAQRDYLNLAKQTGVVTGLKS